LTSYVPSNCSFCQVDAQVFVQAPNVTLIDITVDGTGSLSGCSSPDLAGVDFDNGSSGTLWRVALRNQNIPDGNGGYCPGSGGGFGQGGAAGAAIVSEHASSVAVYDSGVRGFSRYGLIANYVSQVTNSVVVRDTTFVGVGGQNCGADVLAFANSLEVSGSTLANCNRGVLVFPSAGQVTVNGNTIVNPVQDGVNIIRCSTLNISNNTIVGNGTSSRGIWLTCPGNSNYNEISGVHIAIETTVGNTVTGNEINGADIGIDHAPGNTVSNNTFPNVTTLTTQ
jgi:Periplasmic copper-binding protein (NosD)